MSTSSITKTIHLPLLEENNYVLRIHDLDIGARCSSVVRAFAHGAMGRRIDLSWWNH